MLLAIDIGNSDITLGISKKEVWTHVWRVPSVTEKPELFYGIRIRDYFFESGISTEQIEKIIVSSVVPGLTDKITRLITALFQKKPLVLGPEVYKKLPIGILNPFEIGSDLVANALAAFMEFKGDCLVVDFGTALTFTTVHHKAIAGVAIAPGLKTALRSLSENTAKLFDVPLQLPKSALGKGTVHAIQAGILLGYEGLVKSMVERIKSEVSNPQLPVVATGGLSSVISTLNETFTVIDPNLTLTGLRRVGELF